MKIHNLQEFIKIIDSFMWYKCHKYNTHISSISQ